MDQNCPGALAIAPDQPHPASGGQGVYVLGINAYHAGASACLIRDGQLLAAAEEERFNRIKYCAGFPTQAITWCLAEAGIGVYELDHVGISRDPRAHFEKKILHTLRHRPSISVIRDRLHNASRVLDPRRVFVEAFQLDPRRLKARFHNVEHHRAHMASAYFVSPFTESAVLSVDGMGDFCSTMWGVGRGNRLDVLGSVHFPHSLGIFYTALSQWLGFEKYGDEGKVMGLAPYGKPTYLDEMRKLLRVQRDGTFELDLDWFVHHVGGASMTWAGGSPVLGTLYSPKLVECFGAARDPRRNSIVPPASAAERRLEAGRSVHQDAAGYSAHYLDVAASMQAALEEAEFALVNMVQRATGQRALCLAGGVALNSVFNGKIRPSTAFEDVYIQPAAGDAGTSLGAAYYVYHHLLGYPRCYVMDQSATGPGFSDRQVLSALEAHGLAYRRLDEEALCRATAALIDAGKVVGWFQGRMEWGPRALGHRSILANPRRSDTKDILNARIKRRERFRPFAPSVLAEATGAYFDQDYLDPFMTKVYGVRSERQSEIPAVTHVDGTGRLQTVACDTDALFWRVIKEFELLTGTPVIVNTSFNENEPIVCGPDEAIQCFLRTRMDALAIGSFLMQKR
jgi:carbamoyltransferase